MVYQGLSMADREIVENVTPVLAGTLCAFSLDDVAALVASNANMQSLLQDDFALPRGIKKRVLLNCLGRQRDDLYLVMYEGTRALLAEQYPDHKALLGEPEAKQWYYSQLEVLRSKIVKRLQGA